MNIDELRSRLRRYQGFLQQDPSNIKLISDVADLHLQLGEFEQARGLLEKALTQWPSQPSLLSGLASVAMADGEPDVAIRLLNNILEMEQDNPVIYYNLAYAYLYSDQPDNAKQALVKIKDSKSVFPQIPLLLARAQHHLGEMDEAIEHAQEYLNDHPDDPDAFGVLALLYFDLENKAQAQLMAEKALSLDENNLNALVTLGSLALTTDTADVAAGYFERAIARQPKNGRGWSGMGLADMLRLNLPKAIEDLKQAVKYMPSHIGTWHSLAWCQLLTDDLQGAEENFMQSMKIDHNFAETHGGLAVVHIMQGRPDLAEAEVKRAIRLNPNSFAGRYAKSLLMSKADPEKAQEIIKNILASSPTGKEESLQAMLQRIMKKKSFG